MSELVHGWEQSLTDFVRLLWCDWARGMGKGEGFEVERGKGEVKGMVSGLRMVGWMGGSGSTGCMHCVYIHTLLMYVSGWIVG